MCLLYDLLKNFIHANWYTPGFQEYLEFVVWSLVYIYSRLVLFDKGLWFADYWVYNTYVGLIIARLWPI